jgi:sarcosine oxidase subunit delta
MKIMNCPLNGPRNIAEFACGGEVRAMPDTEACSDTEWACHVFMTDNPAGEVTEWWLHLPTSFWFIARRDTVTDEILETMTVQDFRARRRRA